MRKVFLPIYHLPIFYSSRRNYDQYSPDDSRRKCSQVLFDGQGGGAGVEEPSRGHVIVDGENVVALSEDRLSELRLTKMGFIFQNYNLLANFTARENVEVPLSLAGVPKRARRRQAEVLLDSVGLADRAKHYPSELSGGQQQRVAIARALANAPPILIGDEITGDLDSVTGFEVMEIIAKLNRDKGTTIIYVTHDPRMAKFAERLIKLQDGLILQ